LLPRASGARTPTLVRRPTRAGWIHDGLLQEVNTALDIVRVAFRLRARLPC
jgi:hypothetical protein